MGANHRDIGFQARYDPTSRSTIHLVGAYGPQGHVPGFGPPKADMCPGLGRITSVPRDKSRGSTIPPTHLRGSTSTPHWLESKTPSGFAAPFFVPYAVRRGGQTRASVSEQGSGGHASTASVPTARRAVTTAAGRHHQLRWSPRRYASSPPAPLVTSNNANRCGASSCHR